MPPGELLVSPLGVVVSQAVELPHSRLAGLSVVTVLLLDVLQMRRDQRAAFGQRPGLAQEVVLIAVRNRDGSRPAALGPARFQGDVVAADGIARVELDGFFSPQAKGRLQPHAHPDVGVLDSRELRLIQGLGLRFLRDERPRADAIGPIVPCHHALLVDLASPPANRGQPVLEGAGADALLAPVGNQGIHVLWLERGWSHAAVAQLMKLGRDQVQHPPASGLGCITAVAIPATEFLQLVIQVFHGAVTSGEF